MGNSRAGAGGGTTLRNAEQRSAATEQARGGESGAITTRHGSRRKPFLPRRKPRLGPADRNARRRRRLHRFLVTGAIIGAGLVAGLVGGMISGVA